MSGRIIPTILGKRWRFPGIGPLPTFSSLWNQRFLGFETPVPLTYFFVSLSEKHLKFLGLSFYICVMEIITPVLYGCYEDKMSCHKDKVSYFQNLG